MARERTLGAELGLGLATGDGTITGTVTRDTTVFRSGAASYKFDSGGASSPATITITTGVFVLGSSVFARAYFRINDLPTTTSILLRFGGAAYPSVRIKSNGKFGLYDPSSTQIGSDSTTTVTAGDGVWYRIGFQLNIGTGTVDSAELQVNGSSVASTTAQTWSDTLPTALNVGWNTSAGSNKICWADDIAINDTSGASETSFPGAGSVIALFPASTSSAGGWTVGAGGTLAGATSNIPPQGVADVSTVTTQIRSASATADDTVALTTATYDSKMPSGATITLVQSYVDHAEAAATGTKNMDSAVTTNPSGSFHTAIPFGNNLGTAGTWPSNWFGTYGTPVYAPTVTTSSGAVISVRDKTNNTNVVNVDQMALLVEYTGGANTYTKSGSGISDYVGSGSRTRNVVAKTGSGLSDEVGSGSRTRDVVAKTGLGISDYVGSGAKTVQSGNTYIKTGIALADMVGSGSRTRDVVNKTGIAISDQVGSGAKVNEKTKTGSAISAYVGSGSRARDISKSGLGISDYIGSGTRARDVVAKTGLGISAYVGSGSKVNEKTKTGIAISAYVGSGSRTRDVVPKTGIAQSDYVGSGSRARDVTPKTGSATSPYVGSGSRVRDVVPKSGAGISAYIGSGDRARDVSKTGIGISAYVGGGAKVFIHTAIYLDATTITVKPKILFKEIWSGDAALPHADDIILVHGKVRVRIGEHLYI
jgi:hypothetical protein